MKSKIVLGKPDLDEVRVFSKNDESCMKVVERNVTVMVHPIYSQNISKGILVELDALIQRYSDVLEGLVLGYESPRLVSTHGWLFHTNPFNHLLVSATFYVFAPQVGSVVTAVVKKKSPNHLGCLVHGTFNISVPKPQNPEAYGVRWAGSKLMEGNQVRLMLTDIHFGYYMPHMRAEIIPPSETETIEPQEVGSKIVFNDDSGISSNEADDPVNQNKKIMDYTAEREEEEQQQQEKKEKKVKQKKETWNKGNTSSSNCQWVDEEDGWGGMTKERKKEKKKAKEETTTKIKQEPNEKSAKKKRRQQTNQFIDTNIKQESNSEEKKLNLKIKKRKRMEEEGMIETNYKEYNKKKKRKIQRSDCEVAISESHTPTKSIKKEKPDTKSIKKEKPDLISLSWMLESDESPMSKPAKSKTKQAKCQPSPLNVKVEPESPSKQKTKKKKSVS